MYNYIDFNKLFNNESNYGKKMNCGHINAESGYTEFDKILEEV